MTTLIVMAKECVPGRVKTRLHPPLSLADAARLAQACLDDTVARTRVVGERRVLCLQGSLPPIAGFAQVPQVPGDLDERIGAVLDQVRGPVLLIGMDTPQVDPVLLQCLANEWPRDVDAWFGPAADGGFWLLGLSELPGMSRGDLVRGVPMSRSDTGRNTRDRLVRAGLRVRDVPELSDIDDIASLRVVAREVDPAGRVASVLRELRREGALDGVVVPRGGLVTRRGAEVA
ncbi:DUF2064 domain-containing protein [Microbacterium esteraromaticum]|uniref:TIGR04282 family arsenosugar biosynthesis glycosyltransferase n=1 Tax=Microbacterium esteraromaticum TaxID=57043 RepID=UPI0015CE4F2F|nr:DUF2064 domain-containing protein [Microbacterium esteraromaticum]MBN8424679.1 DUF2064 domain-containing protein [Microbacterium esteraromaticum]